MFYRFPWNLTVLFPWNEFRYPRSLLQIVSKHIFLFFKFFFCCFQESVNLFFDGSSSAKTQNGIFHKNIPDHTAAVQWPNIVLSEARGRSKINWTRCSSVHLNAFSLPALCFDYCLSFTIFDIPYPGRSWDSAVVQQQFQESATAFIDKMVCR